jgi:tRNA-splicing ligase RtcB
MAGELVVRREWLAAPYDGDVARALDRLERTEDVVAMAVMPDVHLAEDVCVGTVTASRTRLFPAAVGGDIGCGMVALAFDVPADAIDSAGPAARILDALYETVPITRHGRREAPALESPLADTPLSAAVLESRKREAAQHLGTVGRGNHFVELQRDEDGGLWAMIHSGSRGMGQAIRDHHVASAGSDRTGIQWLEAGSAEGAGYLADVEWARGYARANRARILERVCAALLDVASARPELESRIEADHNHVVVETHAGERVFVHRKGAQSAKLDEPGIIPGSMGSESFHVAGRGVVESLCSSSHGAGRAKSRSDARRTISRAQLFGDTRGVWFDHRLADRLREEAPRAYKDIGAVMRAQRELVRVVRTLRPVLVFKGA